MLVKKAVSGGINHAPRRKKFSPQESVNNKHQMDDSRYSQVFKKRHKVDKILKNQLGGTDVLVLLLYAVDVDGPDLVANPLKLDDDLPIRLFDLGVSYIKI